MRTKEQLINSIQKFIGKGGYVAFEHGFMPGYNAYGVAYDYVDLRLPLGGKRKSYFKDMTEQQLTMLLIDLFDYYTYCQTEA